MYIPSTLNIDLILCTLLVSRSEYPRDKPFLLTMVSYLKKKIKLKEKKKLPQALSELPANWLDRFSQKGSVATERTQLTAH